MQKDKELHEKVDKAIDLMYSVDKRTVALETKISLLPCVEEKEKLIHAESRISELERFRQNQTGFVAGVATVVTLLITMASWFLSLFKQQ